jgi:hypothetical protein
VGQAGSLRGGCLPPPSLASAAVWPIANRPQLPKLPHNGGLVRSHPVPARAGFRVLTSHVDLPLYYLAATLRGSSTAAADLPDVREDHHALIHSGDPGVDRSALVNVETDRIANSLNTLTVEIFSWERTY